MMIRKLSVWDVGLSWLNMVRVVCCGRFDLDKVVIGVVVVVSNRWWKIGCGNLFVGVADSLVFAVVVDFVVWVVVCRMMIRGCEQLVRGCVVGSFRRWTLTNRG